MNAKAWQAALFGWLLVVAGGAWSAEMAGHAVGRNVADAKFAAFPGLPACTPGSVLSGDPAKGAAIILAKADTGCTVPWHWHSANEHLMIVKGAVRLEMRSGKPITIREGGYAMLPAKHVHQFVCTQSCLFYVHSRRRSTSTTLTRRERKYRPGRRSAKRQATADERRSGFNNQRHGTTDEHRYTQIRS